MNDGVPLPSGRDRYRVIRPVRSTAFSVASRATDRLLDREVLLLELRSEFRGDPVAERLLGACIDSTSDLLVPGVPRAFDRGAGSGAGGPWLVSEPVTGPSVLELGRGRPEGPEAPEGPASAERSFDSGTVLRWARALAGTMREVHAQGVVHGALGPDTVLVSGGQVWVTGFGPQASELAVPSDPALTVRMWSRFTASLSFPSPEQVDGAAPGRRSDVYGFGRVLEALIALVVDDDPPFTVRRGLLDRLAASCVDASSARRPPSFPAVVEALASIEAHGSDRAAAPGEESAGWSTAAVQLITTAQPTAGGRDGLTRALPTATPAPTAVIPVAVHGRRAPAPREARRRRGPGRRWSSAARLTVATAAIAAVVGLIATHSVLTPAVAEKNVTVPELRGRTIEEASHALAAAGVIVAGQRPEASPLQPGVVSGTDPGPGSAVRSGQSVTLLVSTGPGEAPVPQLAGLDVAGARQALTDAGLGVGAIVARDSAEREGTVLSSDPAFGARVAAGTAIGIVVASGRVRVPAGLAGQASQPVVDALAALGLQAQTYTVDTDEYVSGVVLKLEPGEGARLAVGGIVTLSVSRYVPGPGTSPPVREEPTSPPATGARTPAPTPTPTPSTG